MSDFSARDVKTFMLEDDGQIPNNPKYPVVVYPGALPENSDREAFCRQRLREHGWGGTWVNGIYGHHHYHSNTHEFLGVISGRARLLLGGPDGVELEVDAGDALVLPAGTGHKCLDASSDFRVVGSYPGGADYDMNTGEAGERPQVLENIREVGRPSADPLFGSDGPLLALWAD